MATTNQTMYAKYRYEAFGKLILALSSGWGQPNPYRFSSKEFHSATEMYYYGYRWYNPDLQRWMNRDPIGITGGINLYGMVRNNPITRADLWGLNSVPVTPLPPPRPPWVNTGTPHEDDGRASIVCDGKGGIRIYYPDGKPPFPNNKCMAGCLEEHENCHKEEALRANPDICKGALDGTAITAPENIINESEVRCSQRELDCLTDKQNNCECGDLSGRIKEVEKYRDKYKKLSI